MDIFEKLKPVIWIIGVAFAVFFFVDTRYALSTALIGFQETVYSRWDNEEKRELRHKIWELESIYGVGCANCPPDALKNYREYQAAIEEINARKGQKKD